MRIRRASTVVLALALAAPPAGAQKPAPITGHTLDAIQAWVQAVRSHTPGRDDDAVQYVAALTYDDRVQLDAGMALFLDGLRGGRYNTGGNPAAKAIVEAGRAAGAPDVFLKRAAVLHADAVDDPGPGEASAQRARPTEAGMRGRMTAPERISPLLQTTALPQSRDGEIISETRTTWHLPFGRYLLDLVGTREKPDPFVAAWYHATNAALFSRESYGDLTAHLEHAERILPNDPWLLFDRGCYAETLGLPLLQSTVSERDEAMQRFNARAGPPTWRPLGSSSASRIPPASRTFAEAERLYRRALSVDPSLVEARVRLARLLDERGRHQEADEVIAIAVAQPPTGMAGFYAHLFAGRIRQALGRLDDASSQYQSALVLFPQAQSALVASSQVALLKADVPSALAPIERLGEPDADPWWFYHFCAGRDADALLQALWDGMPR